MKQILNLHNDNISTMNLYSVRLNPVNIRRNSREHIRVTNGARAPPRNQPNQSTIIHQRTSRVSITSSFPKASISTQIRIENWIWTVTFCAIRVANSLQVDKLKSIGQASSAASASPSDEGYSETRTEERAAEGNGSDHATSGNGAGRLEETDVVLECVDAVVGVDDDFVEVVAGSTAA